MLHHLALAVRRQYFGILAFALVLAAGADAATGGNLILGRVNTAGGTTTLRNTSDGAALALNVKQGQPPLTVSSGVEVPRLNASRLNGKRAGAFAPATGSPNYVPKGSLPLLVKDLAVPATTDSYYIVGYLTAPGDGAVSVSAFGQCIGHGFIEIDVNDVSRKAEIGDGQCGLAASFPVSAGAVIVELTVSGFDPDSLKIESGNWAVWFEPS